jgi:hypothetical protein
MIKPGDRVRVTAVAPFDHTPKVAVNDIVTVEVFAPKAERGFDYLETIGAGSFPGTWCRVEPVVEASVPAVLQPPGYVEPITRASFLEAFVDANPGSFGIDATQAWDALHSNASTSYGGVGEIDEDPTPARRGQPSPYSERP